MDIQTAELVTALRCMQEYYTCLGVPLREQRVLLFPEDGQLSLVGAHHGMSWFRYQFQERTNWRGPTCYSLEDLRAAVGWACRFRPDDVIKLARGPMSLTLVYEGSQVTIPCHDNRSFPELEYRRECGWGPAVSFGFSQFEGPLRFVVPAICQDERHPNLRVANLTASELAASDGHRLHVVHFSDLTRDSLMGLLGTRQYVRLPRETAVAISAFSANLGVCTTLTLEDDLGGPVSLGSGFIRVERGPTTLYGRVDQRSEYPDWRKVLPEFRYSIHVEFHALLRALRPMLASEAPVLVTVVNSVLHLDQQTDQGAYKASLPCDSQVGEGVFPGVYALNAVYLYEALEHFHEGPICWEGRGVEDAIRLTQEGFKAWCVVMPLRR